MGGFFGGLFERFNPSREVLRRGPGPAPRPAPKVRTYDGARTDRLNASQKADYGGPNLSIRSSLALMRARARHMAENNSHAKRFVNLVARQVIGPHGVKAKFEALKRTGKTDADASRLLAAAWAKWGRLGNCDITGTKSFWMISTEALKAVARDGEVLLRKHWGAARGPYGFQVELIESDRLDETYNAAADKNGVRIIMGVEVNKDGKPLAYHLFTENPRDYGYFSAGSILRERVPADEIIHFFLPPRVGSVRGMSWLKAAMDDLYQLREYRRSEQIAAREGANKGGFFTPEPGGDEDELGGNEIQGEGEEYEEGVTSSDTGEPETYDLNLESQPGTYQVLPPGWKFTPNDPTHPNAGFEKFDRAVLLSVAAGLDASFSGLTGDWTGFSYATGRLSLLDERDVWMGVQQVFIDVVLEDIGQEWVLAYLTSPSCPFSILDRERLSHIRWIPRRWPWVDPKKDAEANILLINNRLRSRKQITAEAGDNFEDVVSDQAEEEALMKAAGLTVPSAKGAAPVAAEEADTGRGRARAWRLFRRRDAEIRAKIKDHQWIGVDLDGTLARFENGQGPKIGAPIEAMVERVKKWVEDGIKVKILTARANDEAQIPAIEKWLTENGLEGLPVTTTKGPGMYQLWDDKAVRVTLNEGEPCCDSYLEDEEGENDD